MYIRLEGSMLRNREKELERRKEKVVGIFLEVLILKR